MRHQVYRQIFFLLLFCILILYASTNLFCVDKVLTEKKAQEWQREIKSALFIPTPLPPLNSTVLGHFEPEEGICVERVTFGTQFGMRIPAILYLPETIQDKIPALIIVNGHGGDKYSWYSFYSGILYARAGAAVLTFDPIGEGERNIIRKSGTRAHDTFIDPPEMAQRLGGQLICDVMQAISFLCERKEIDNHRIAVMGYSLGSFITAITGAIDPRIRVCVLAGGGNLDEYDGYWDNSKPMCQGIPYRSLRFLGDRAAAIYALHALRGPTLIFNGLDDTVVAIPTHGLSFFEDLKARTVKLLGFSQGIFQTEFVPKVSHRPFFVTRPVSLWLEEKLDFPKWEKEDILNMSETHISEWAKINEVDMDHRYSLEKREGGVRALGIGVPALSRDLLTVFDKSTWESKKVELIYENWVKRAKKLVEGN